MRIVTYLDSQREQATNFVYKEFEGSRPKVEGKYNPKGYRGTHLVLRLDEGREKLSEYSRFKGLKCEVQVSSILYHAWSEIEHDVIYKPGADREKLESLGLDDIEASFENIMAQKLEEATIQFDRLYKKHKEVLAAGMVIYADSLVRNTQRGVKRRDRVRTAILPVSSRTRSQRKRYRLQKRRQSGPQASLRLSANSVNGRFSARPTPTC